MVAIVEVGYVVVLFVVVRLWDVNRTMQEPIKVERRIKPRKNNRRSWLVFGATRNDLVGLQVDHHLINIWLTVLTKPDTPNPLHGKNNGSPTRSNCENVGVVQRQGSQLA